MPKLVGFFLCVLIWGSTWFFVEWQLGVVAKEWSVAYRFGLATAAMFIIARVRGYSLWIGPRQHATMLAIGLFMFSTNYIMVYGSTQYLTSGLVAVGFSLLTVMNIVNARIWLGLRIHPRIMLASLLGIAGLVLMFVEEVDALSLTDATLIGLAYCLAATLLASTGNTFAATKTMTEAPLLVANGWGMLYGTAINILIALTTAGLPSFDPSAKYIFALLYLSLLGTVAAFTVYMWLIANWGVARSAYMAVLTPVVALIISSLFEGYVWTFSGILGLALILVGNVLMIKAREQAPAGVKPPEPQAEPQAPLRRPAAADQA